MPYVHFLETCECITDTVFSGPSSVFRGADTYSAQDNGHGNDHGNEYGNDQGNGNGNGNDNGHGNGNGNKNSQWRCGNSNVAIAMTTAMPMATTLATAMIKTLRGGDSRDGTHTERKFRAVRPRRLPKIVAL